MLRLAQKAEVRNTSEVLVLISTQSHASFVALEKSLYVLKFTFFFFLPVNSGQWPPPAEEGDGLQHRKWHRASRE